MQSKAAPTPDPKTHATRPCHAPRPLVRRPAPLKLFVVTPVEAPAAAVELAVEYGVTELVGAATPLSEAATLNGAFPFES